MDGGEKGRMIFFPPPCEQKHCRRGRLSELTEKGTSDGHSSRNPVNFDSSVSFDRFRSFSKFITDICHVSFDSFRYFVIFCYIVTVVLQLQCRMNFYGQSSPFSRD